MLEIKQLCKEFTSDKKHITKALTDINITFPSKGFISIVGKSGSGKSTLLNIIAGLISQTSGEYYIEDRNSKDLSKEDWNLLRDQYFGFIFQNYNLIDNASVYENLKIVLLGKENADKKIDEILKKFDIYELRDKQTEDLSGGEKQRVAIARACLKESKVILADEPSASLDEENTITVFECLKEVSKDRLVLLVTHDTEYAEKYSDSIIKINYGKIVQNDIMSNDEKNNLDIKKKKVSVKDALFLQKMFCSRQKFRKVFSSLLSVILCSVVTLCIYFFTYDIKAYEAKYLVSTNSEAFISEDKNSLEPVADYMEKIDAEYKNKYPSVSFNDAYVGKYTFTVDFFGGQDYWDDVFNTIVIDDTLNDMEIIPTDYTLTLLNGTAINFEDVNQTVGEKLTLFDKEFLIKSVNIKNDGYIQRWEMDADQECYDITYMNQNTLNEITELKYYKSVLSDASNHEFVCLNQHFEMEESIFEKGKIENYDDIILGMNALYKLTGFNKEDYADDTDGSAYQAYVNSYINSTMHLSLSNLDGQVIEGDFNVKGVVWDDESGSSIYFSDNYLKSVSATRILITPNDYVIRFSSSKDAKSFLKKLRGDKLDIYSSANKKVDETNSYIKANSKFLKYAFFVCAFTLVSFSYFFEKLNINSNSKKIGIGYSMGISNKEMSLLFSIDTMKESAVSSLITIIISIGIILFIDYFGVDSPARKNPVFVINPAIHLLAVLSLAVLSLAIMAVINYRIRKIDILQLMKK